ncbi:MAG TPA: adenylate/guanylate cyclase domain-containing protein [Candidatus Binatia bacterium]|jgi:TolB-like protein/class 3 adenylate cyclase/Tfp pilus assembly protein PilF|nr:adenylate/guanylate cyclase domain-containing protein [Candidatus Binatia bacterium]
MQEDLAGTAAETRKLAAIMFTDVVGFSRQMGNNEARMLRLLDIHNHLIEQAVAEHRGHVIKSTGDGFLVDFPSAVNAVQCAQRIQAQFRTYNAEKEKPEQIHVRIGLHLGDIVQRDGDVFGDGVNVAARLQALAEPDTICISHAVYREVEKKLSLGTVVSLGRPKLKNIVERFQVYALLLEPPKGLRQTLQIQWLKLSRRVGTAHRVAAGFVLLAATIIAVWYLARLPLVAHHSSLVTQETPALPLPDKPSIVVLPFVNMSNDPEQEYFSDGITEDITTDLSKLSSLFVIARNSAFTYKGKTAKIQDIGRALGVQYVVEGSVRRAGDQLRITAQLVDATTGGHLWSERYDRALQEVFAVQDEIREKIVFALKVKLTPEEQERFRQSPTANLEAYDYFLRGREAYSHAWYEYRKEASAQARQMFEKAIELDSQYAGAYVGLGWTYWIDFFFGWAQDPAQSLGRALELAQRAVALDDALPGAHQILGTVYLFQRQHEQAIAEIERAIVLNPSSAANYSALGVTLEFAGRLDEGVQALEQALRLDPRNPTPYLIQLGHAYRSAGQCEKAIAPIKQALNLNPAIVPARANLAVCYIELGREEEARAEAAEVLRRNPNFSVETAWRKENQPFKDPTPILERLYAAARKAGLK